ncbi:cGMP-dependent 3',5'-cyclic phosphodiesterase-like isoform X2 [Ptychodera flava]|uniref:cGMP-dependent 3',5'-cyclic phosphodiesterase-like isoform X2 n=1 Tax=Ptychodera flava TaxID=63121 RepID=UPI00396A17F7
MDRRKIARSSGDRSGTCEDDGDEVADSLLKLCAVIDWDSLSEAINEVTQDCLPNVTDIVVYLIESKTGNLKSKDKVSHAVHDLPKSGLARSVYDSRRRMVCNDLPSEDPCTGLLPSGVDANSTQRKVVLSPVCHPESDRVLCLLGVVCDSLSQVHQQNLILLEKHIAVCIQRLLRTCQQQTPSQSDGILKLCEDLHDKDAGTLQLKVTRYLEEQTESQCCIILFLCEETGELFCQVLGNRVLDSKIILPHTTLSHVIASRKSATVEDLPDCQAELSRRLGFEVTSMMCVPLMNKNSSEVAAIVFAVNKKDGKSYTIEDEEKIRYCYRVYLISSSQYFSFSEGKPAQNRTEALLQVAKNLFTHLDDVCVLLQEVMQEARNMTHAERCSLFLVENDELVAKVFDGNVTENGEVLGEVRIPINQGIAGLVATTGTILNIKDAYAHPLFYRGVDETTGFRTRNILCFPIKDDSEKVIGIAELCNKINGSHFTKHDEEVALAFSVYCGISIVHSLLYKKVKDAQYRSKLSNELMMYHMQINHNECERLTTTPIPEPRTFQPDMDRFSCIPRSIAESDTSMAVISMFDDMGFIRRWRINKATLVRFCLMVKRGYRDPPYHNWYHAFSVGHFCYLLYKNLNLLEMLTEMEIFALFVACLCHDLDHRGTNNTFQVQSQSVLAALYSSEGSVLERHHFAQALCILNTDGCNIFENLTSPEYQEVLDLMQDIILATDLAHHLRITKDLQKMADEGYNKDDPKSHKLLLSLLMTSCDLSDQTKNWKTIKKIAELIYQNSSAKEIWRRRWDVGH